MPACENQYVSRNRTQSANDAVRTGADLLRRFAFGAAVAEQVPVRALRADFGAPAALVFAIVPLDEVRVDLGHGAKPGQLACLACALQWTGEYFCESQPLETFTESPSRALALLGEWEVSQPSMLARQGPSGFTVSRQIDYGKIVFQCVISLTPEFSAAAARCCPGLPKMHWTVSRAIRSSSSVGITNACSVESSVVICLSNPTAASL